MLNFRRNKFHCFLPEIPFLLWPKQKHWRINRLEEKNNQVNVFWSVEMSWWKQRPKSNAHIRHWFYIHKASFINCILYAYLQCPRPRGVALSGKELKLPWGVGRGGPRDLGGRTRLGSSFYKDLACRGLYQRQSPLSQRALRKLEAGKMRWSESSAWLDLVGWATALDWT